MQLTERTLETNINVGLHLVLVNLAFNFERKGDSYHLVGYFLVTLVNVELRCESRPHSNH